MQEGTFFRLQVLGHFTSIGYLKGFLQCLNQGHPDNESKTELKQ